MVRRLDGSGSNAIVIGGGSISTPTPLNGEVTIDLPKPQIDPNATIDLPNLKLLSDPDSSFHESTPYRKELEAIYRDPNTFSDRKRIIEKLFSLQRSGVNIDEFIKNCFAYEKARSTYFDSSETQFDAAQTAREEAEYAARIADFAREYNDGPISFFHNDGSTDRQFITGCLGGFTESLNSKVSEGQPRKSLPPSGSNVIYHGPLPTAVPARPTAEPGFFARNKKWIPFAGAASLLLPVGVGLGVANSHGDNKPNTVPTSGRNQTTVVLHQAQTPDTPYTRPTPNTQQTYTPSTVETKPPEVIEEPVMVEQPMEVVKPAAVNKAIPADMPLEDLKQISMAQIINYTGDHEDIKYLQRIFKSLPIVKQNAPPNLSENLKARWDEEHNADWWHEPNNNKVELVFIKDLKTNFFDGQGDHGFPLAIKKTTLKEAFNETELKALIDDEFFSDLTAKFARQERIAQRSKWSQPESVAAAYSSVLGKHILVIDPSTVARSKQDPTQTQLLQQALANTRAYSVKTSEPFTTQ